jgi:hypothetical protein
MNEREKRKHTTKYKKEKEKERRKDSPMSLTGMEISINYVTILFRKFLKIILGIFYTELKFYKRDYANSLWL